MKLIQVTLGAGATQIAASAINASAVVVQNNATHVVRVGDSTVSATKGISIAVSGELVLDGFSARGTGLNEWYLFGTAGDVIDVAYEAN